MAQKSLKDTQDYEELTELKLENDSGDQGNFHSDFMDELSNVLADANFGSSPLREDISIDRLTVTTQTPENTIAEANCRCSVCGQLCAGYKGMRQHTAKAHSVMSKSVECQICGKFFKHKNAVRFHQRQVHEKITRVNCPICLKEIYNKYMLTKHLRSSHYTNLN